MKKPDPVIEKLDEILKELKRIEAKPAIVVTQPFHYYPPVYVQPPAPLQPYSPWHPWTVWCGSETYGQNTSGTYMTTVGSTNLTVTNAGRN
jgi:hypothetical protein